MFAASPNTSSSSQERLWEAKAGRSWQHKGMVTPGEHTCLPVAVHPPRSPPRRKFSAEAREASHLICFQTSLNAATTVTPAQLTRVPAAQTHHVWIPWCIALASPHTLRPGLGVLLWGAPDTPSGMLFTALQLQSGLNLQSQVLCRKEIIRLNILIRTHITI